MSEASLWLVGSSEISQDYARVLMALNQPFEVIGRSESSALLFKKKINHSIKTGGLNFNLKKFTPPHTAIVAVGIEELASVAKDLICFGTKRILLEKPGGLDFEEIRSLSLLANEKKVEILLGYNRRFYNSVQLAKKLIEEDGGLLSINFEFTEWSHKIKSLKKGIDVKEHWLLGNSSHVIDLAFYFSGKPRDWKCWNAGSLDWHKAGARFCGSGITEKGIMFSYFSDWEAPGRWGLELMTSKHRYILRPLEQLQVVKTGSVILESIDLENNLDQEFKPGLFLQTKKFLMGENYLFCNLSEQVENVRIYSKIAGYL